MAASEQGLFRSDPRLSEVYRDGRATILASNSTRPRAEYWTNTVAAGNQQAILDAIKKDPAVILGPPMVEGTPIPSSQQTPPAREELAVTSYGLNRIELRAASKMRGGLVVLKDVFASGWRATADGRDAPIVRVNGLVKGVEIPEAGAEVVVLEYRPLAFTAGLLISGVSLLFVLFLAAGGQLGYITADAPGRATSILAVAISALVLIGCVAVYFKVIPSIEALIGVTM
jgi:hypothetical protein